MKKNTRIYRGPQPPPPPPPNGQDLVEENPKPIKEPKPDEESDSDDE